MATLVTETAHEKPGETWASREAYLAEMENRRRDGVRERRLQYDGRQYDEDNRQCIEKVRTTYPSSGAVGERGLARWAMDAFQLPEHLRRHAYSGHIRECVDFIADRLAEGFTVEASTDKRRARASESKPDRDPPSSEDRDTTDPVQQIIDDCLAASPELSGGDDEDDQLTIATVLREAAKAGDTVALVRWDNVEQHCWLEFWGSEQVDLRFVDNHPDRLERVLADQLDWRVIPGTGNPDEQQCVIRREWLLSDAPETAHGDPDVPAVSVDREGAPLRRCVERVWVIDKGPEIAERPVEVIEWGVPVLPWWPIRVEHADLRDTRGTSLVTDQAMRHADRYNAVEQVSWLIARYNSHSNAVATGEVTKSTVGADGVARGTVVHKDVADFVLFPSSPGGVNVTALSLPTDPQMIEHQKKTLTEALYGAFGLNRTDSESVSETGQVSGYALEILNQKSEGTFARIRARLIRDIKHLLGVVVDCHVAWTTGATTPPDPADDDPLTADPNADTDVPEGDQPASDLSGDTDPYPRRSIRVSLGSGWIVDDAKLRDDQIAGVISRRGMWRERGKSDDWIDQNEDELAEEKQQAVELAREKFQAEGGEAAQRFGARQPAPNGQAPPGQQRTPAQPGQSQQAGRTVNDARTPQSRDQAQRASAGRSER